MEKKKGHTKMKRSGKDGNKAGQQRSDRYAESGVTWETQWGESSERKWGDR